MDSKYVYIEGPERSTFGSTKSLLTVLNERNPMKVAEGTVDP